MNKFLKLSMIAVMAMAVASCSDDINDDGKDSPKKCVDGAKHCVAGIPQLCVDGVWVQSACKEGQLCSYGVCKDNCTNNGAKQCSAAGVPELCVDGVWVQAAACSGAKTCVDGVCKDNCTNGAKRCVAGVPQLCMGGEWAVQAACSGGQTCVEGVCTGGKLGASCNEATFVDFCDGNKLVFCDEDDGGVLEDDCDSTELLDDLLCLPFASYKVYGCVPAHYECATAGQSQLCTEYLGNYGFSYLWGGACHVASNGKSYMVEIEEAKICSSACTSATTCEVRACSVTDYVASCNDNVALTCLEDDDHVFRWDCSAIGATCVLEDGYAYCDDEG